MFDKQAIQELAQAQAISAANTAVQATATVVALTDNFVLHDLEKFIPNRRRARGMMSTPLLADFASYVGKHAEAGASIFVGHDTMVADAVLNLGTPEAPGHADNRAQFAPPRTAAFKALLGFANGAALKQQAVAEFFEDWEGFARMEFFSEGSVVSAAKAITAVRQITIESAKRVETTEKQLGAQRSAFESVQASSIDLLPTLVHFNCAPYVGLDERQFAMRLGVLTGDAKPMLSLRIINLEQHQQDMANELAALVCAAFAGGSAVPVAVGSYKAAS